MTTTTVFASGSDGRVTSTHATYATAVAGAGLSSAILGTTGWIGQTTGFTIEQLFFEFDTSGIADTDAVSNVGFSLDGNTDESTTDCVMTALDYVWDGSLATTDWQDATELGALTELATYNSSAYSSSYMDFTSAGAAFNSHINKTGSTFFMCASDRNISSTQPTNAERVRVTLSENAGTTADPKLVITHASAGGIVIPPLMHQYRQRRV